MVVKLTIGYTVLSIGILTHDLHLIKTGEINPYVTQQIPTVSQVTIPLHISTSMCDSANRKIVNLVNFTINRGI